MSVIRTSAGVVSRQLGDGAVVVHLPSSEIFELNGTAARVWSLLAEGRDTAEIATLLAGEFDISADDVAQEIRILVAELSSKRLIQV